jgi:hypothetical protein
MQNQKTLPSLVLISLLGAGTAFSQTTSEETYAEDKPGASHAAEVLTVSDPSSGGWFYPLTEADRHLPSWIQFGGQFRDRFEQAGHIGFGPSNDAYDLTQLRLGVYIRPTKWFELVGVMQDSRVFFNDHVASKPPYQNIFDIREAYAKIGKSDGFFDFVAGREMFSFGDERVIGPSDWLNMGRTFDTVRLDLHANTASASIFAASVINPIDGQIDHHIEGNNLYGIYGSLKAIVPHAVLEPYALWRKAPWNVSLPETQGKGPMSEWTYGFRLAGEAPGGFDYDTEMNKQTGTMGKYDINAWGGHWNVGRAFNSVLGKPRPFVEYNYATGNKNPSGDTWNLHDQLYPSSHDKMDFADQFGWKNIKDLRLGVMEKAGRRFEFTEMVNNLWLASKNDGVYAASGALSIAADPHATGTHLGTEMDLVGTYRTNAHILYGAGYARIFTGTFLKEATKNHDYNYPFAYVTYVF